MGVANAIALWANYRNGTVPDHFNVETVVDELNNLVSCSNI